MVETSKELTELIKLGLVELYEDENGELKARLTKLGKQILKDIKQ